MSPKRVLLVPVYLTASERDTVRRSLDCLMGWLQPSNSRGGVESFACSHTRQRLLELRALFDDKAAGSEK